MHLSHFAVTQISIVVLGAIGIINLLASKEQSERIMELEDKIAELAQDEDKLVVAVTDTLAIVAGIPGAVALAVANALANLPTPVDNSAAIAAIEAIDAKVRETADLANRAIHPEAAPLPPIDSQAVVDQVSSQAADQPAQEASDPVNTTTGEPDPNPAQG